MTSVPTANNAPVSSGTPAGRIGSLDSLRGIAALVVVFYHLSLVVPDTYPRLMSIHPVRPLIAGGAAVLLFFMLSGFVLYLSLDRPERHTWPTFAARRVTRLWPPVVAAVLLSSLLYLVVAPGRIAAYSSWFNDLSWNEPPSAALIAGHLLLLDTHRFQSLDNPIWTLAIELRLSLLFPLLAAGVRRWPVWTLIACLIISAAARHGMAPPHVIGPIDPVFTAQYLDLFSIGAVMARYRERIGQLLRRVPIPIVGAAIMAGLIEGARLYPYVVYASVALMMAASFSFPLLASLYALRPLAWLGSRSFSLYLVHLPMLLAATHVMSGRIPTAVILPAALVLSLAAAEIFWMVVERPSIDLSRQVGRRLSRHRRVLPRR